MGAPGVGSGTLVPQSLAQRLAQGAGWQRNETKTSSQSTDFSRGRGGENQQGAIGFVS